MQRNLENEMDDLRQELRQIKETLTELLGNKEKAAPAGKSAYAGHVHKMPGMHQDPHLMAILDRLENDCGNSGSSGRLAYLGVYSSGGRQATWINANVNADDLLELIEAGTAEKVLACIGSADRLNLLLSILRKPRTVAQLVEECGFTSAGQVYHHLKPLMAADLVEEAERNRGMYVMKPHRVQGVLMLLAGIGAMIDPQFSQGDI